MKALTKLSAKVPAIVVKCGKDGSVVQVENKRIIVPGVIVTPVDTIGAGDSFNAGFLFAFLQGASYEQAARAGNITGALSTLRPGGTEAFRDAALRDSFLREHNFAGL